MKEEQSLVELEEAIETLDVVLKFKSQSSQRKEERLSKSEPEPSSHRRSTDANMRSVRRRLRELSPPDITELFIIYFNKVVRLREAERVLLWRCEKLKLQSSEQDGALRALEEHMQRLALDTDRRLMQQHRDNQRQIQLLLSQLKEMASNVSIWRKSCFPQKLQSSEEQVWREVNSSPSRS
ncbi:hypothetical protein NL108_011300 [Boleophthalmus pectinirostris]|nr:hypothetical protein NL108_011300 [Boleophthalmus pectinirostris]